MIPQKADMNQNLEKTVLTTPESVVQTANYEKEIDPVIQNTDSRQLLKEKYHFNLDNLSESELNTLEQAVHIDLDNAEFALINGRILAYDQQGHRSIIDFNHASKIFGRSAKFRQEMKYLSDLYHEQIPLSPTSTETTRQELLNETSNFAPIDNLTSYDAASIQTEIQNHLRNPDYDLVIDFTSLATQLDKATTPTARAEIIDQFPKSMRNYLQSPEFQALAHADTYQDIVAALAPHSPELQNAIESKLPSLDQLTQTHTSNEFLQTLAQDNSELNQLLHSSAYEQMQNLTSAQNLDQIKSALNIDSHLDIPSDADFSELNQLLQCHSLEEALASPALPDFLRPMFSELSQGLQTVSRNFDIINRATNNTLAPFLNIHRLIQSILHQHLLMWDLQQMSYFLNLRSRDGVNFLAQNYHR